MSATASGGRHATSVSSSLDELIEQAQRIREHREGAIRHTTIASLCVKASYCVEAKRNLLTYAACHGYGVAYLSRPLNTSRALPWHKIPLLLSVMQTPAGFVFWHDADSLFARPELSLASLLPGPSQQLTLSGDRGCWINSGHMMLRARSPWVSALLRDSWDVYPPPEPQGWHEQSSFLFLLSGRKPTCRERVHPSSECCRAGSNGAPTELALKPQQAMNEYLRVTRHAKNFSWVGLILHFPGGTYGSSRKDVTLKKWAAQILEKGRWKSCVARGHIPTQS